MNKSPAIVGYALGPLSFGNSHILFNQDAQHPPTWNLLVRDAVFELDLGVPWNNASQIPTPS